MGGSRARSSLLWSLAVLSLPAFQFTFEVDNLTGTPPVSGNPVGTAFTPGTANTDGTAVTILTALSADVNYLVFGFSNTTISTLNYQCLADVLIDRGGSTNWSNFIDDIVCGFQHAQATNIGLTLWYHFPIWIPAGASIGIQARTASTTATTGRIVMYAFGEPNRPEMWWCGQGVESLGINSSISQGTNVTPVSSGTYSAWTTIGTAGFGYGSVQFGINGSDAGAASNNYFWQLGISSGRLPGSPTISRNMLNNESGVGPSFGAPIWCNVPSGTVWQIRGTGSSAAAAETFNAAIYGVY